MIGDVTLGSNDLHARCASTSDFLRSSTSNAASRPIASSCGTSKPGRSGLGVIKPHDGKPATVGNGGMVALGVDSTTNVDQIHKKALELGGKDEGAPRPRGGNFYGAYFRDLDGNKLCVFTVVKES